MNIANDNGALIVPVPEMDVIASWRGGPYVDLYSDMSDLAPFEALNVWDYEHGCPDLEYRGDMRDVMFNIRQRVLSHYEVE